MYELNADYNPKAAFKLTICYNRFASLDLLIIIISDTFKEIHCTAVPWKESHHDVTIARCCATTIRVVSVRSRACKRGVTYTPERTQAQSTNRWASAQLQSTNLYDWSLRKVQVPFLQYFEVELSKFHVHFKFTRRNKACIPGHFMTRAVSWRSAGDVAVDVYDDHADGVVVVRGDVRVVPRAGWAVLPSKILGAVWATTRRRIRNHVLPM